MAQDVLHAAKSMFHAVLPNSDRQQQSSSSASQFTD
jgi:chemotaxis receptor (MCP) glutamine deamidase CheD